MFGLEIWFVYAVVSTFAIGFYSYTHKVAASKNFNANIFNCAGMFLSAAALFCTSFIVGESLEISYLMIILAGLGGIIFLLGSSFRFESLKHIDATIALPLHKVVSPIGAILMGYLFFHERFAAFEWLGLALSVCIPMLLISSVEKDRQNNLLKGIIFISISALLASVVALFNKLGTDLFSSFLLYAAIANFIGATFGTVQFLGASYKGEGIKSKLVISRSFLMILITSAVFQYIGFVFLMFSFAQGGPLGLVYTIQSLYILIPIILSIIFYNEHWNTRKVIAIVLSIAAVGLLG